MREHGTRARYVHGPNPGSGAGCRCDPCRAAAAKAERDRKRRAAPPYVSADRARTHLANLAAQGIGLKTVARVSGVSHGALTKLIYGDRARGTPPSKRIRPATEKAILGVTAADATGGQRTHTAEDYNALLDRLTGRGWTLTAIADATGVSPSNLRPRPGQEHVTATRMAATRKLLDRTPVTRRDRYGNQAEPAWTPDADRRDRARKATNAQERAERRAANRDDDLPTIDLVALAAQEWRTRAACRLLPDDQTFIFWPGLGDTTTLAAARTVCTHCPVADECVAHAVAAGEHGVWAGTTDRERMAMRSGRRPVAPHLNPRPVDKRRPCGHCGELFLPWAATTRFCSRSCAMRARGGVRLVAS